MSEEAIKERSLEQTPTWAVAMVCFVIVVISIFIEHVLHLVGKWLKKKNKPALSEALEKVKAELMLMGFISLLLAVFQGYISEICISTRVADTWHPCDPNSEAKKYKSKYEDKCAEQGKVAFISTSGIHQLHIFIFVLAACHIIYCIATYALGKIKMKTWKSWENETRTVEYQSYNDPERFRFARETSFGRRHLNFWSRSTLSLWVVCFFRQFYGSVTKVDYLTLRHGFIMAHLPPENQTNFDFRKYINRSLEDDFKVVVGISEIIWFIAVLFLLAYTHGWYSYFWLPFIPLVIILMVGTKLQVIITRMGTSILETGPVVRGTPVVQPGDDLFWFGRPRFLLFLIHVVLFTNAFQLAFFVWSVYQFSINSCYHERVEDIIIRISMGVIIQVLCSYVTLPLYALVNQMGSNMRPTIFNERIASALKSWRHEAKKQRKQGRHSENTSPFASPTRGMSPVHLLHSYPRSVESDHRGRAESFRSPSPSSRQGNQWNEYEDGSHDSQVETIKQVELQGRVEEGITSSTSTGTTTPSQVPLPLEKSKTQHEIDVGSLDFSFRKKN